MRIVGQNNANSKTEPNQFYQIDITLSERVTNYLIPALRISEKGFLRFFQQCFICRSSDSTVWEDAGIEPGALRRLWH